MNPNLHDSPTQSGAGSPGGTVVKGGDRATFPRVARATAALGGSITGLSAQYPRLLESIENSWGSPACETQINDLLLSDRAGRHGFSQEILDEILVVKNAFQMSFPNLASSPFDPVFNAHTQDFLRQARLEAQHPPAASAPPRENTTATPAKRPTVGRNSDEIGSLARLREALARLDHGVAPSGGQHQPLGVCLVSAGAIDSLALERALSTQERESPRRRLGEVLRASNAVTASQLNRALCRQRGIPVVDAAAIELSPEALHKVPLRVARQKQAMPVAMYDQRLVVAVDDPLDDELLQFFSFIGGSRAFLVYAPPESIRAAQAGYGQIGAGHDDAAAHLSIMGHDPHLPDAESGPDTPAETTDEDDSGWALNENDETVIGLVNKVINDAIRLGASDIHFEAFPGTRNAQIRIRRDGMLEAYSEYPLSYHAAVISRLKIMAEIDIAERRRGQDGKISFGRSGHKRDLRLSTIPTSNALETATLRILSAGDPMPLEGIDLAPDILAAFRAEISKPYGLILACGPTGSGKTTTLHSVLHSLNSPQRKIWTAEDPVEIVQRNISQVQVRPKIGWTFAMALRSFLRADPDVIMIGEIRDDETAKVAVEASMTGHLVLTTLHTNSAPETLARLLDLSIEPFNLADAALAILAQRLARRICRDCGETVTLSGDEIDTLLGEHFCALPGSAPSHSERDRQLAEWSRIYANGGPLTARRRVGCPACNGTGYRGRIGIHELLVVTPEIRHLIRSRASTGSIVTAAVAGGMRPLRQDGIAKVLQGHTDLAEVRMVCL